MNDQMPISFHITIVTANKHLTSYWFTSVSIMLTISHYFMGISLLRFVKTRQNDLGILTHVYLLICKLTRPSEGCVCIGFSMFHGRPEENYLLEMRNANETNCENILWLLHNYEDQICILLWVNYSLSDSFEVC